MNNTRQGVERLTAAEGFAAVLFGAVASDGKVTHGEAIELAQALARTSMFRGLTEGQMRAVLARVRALYGAKGLDGLLAAGAPAVPADLRETAFANCADLVFADDRLSPEEEAYLKRAQAALGVGDGAAAKILDVVRTLNKG